MFSSWDEYAYHIIDNLVPEEKNREAIKKEFKSQLPNFMHPKIRKDLCRVIINTVLRADWDWTIFTNWKMSPDVNAYRRWRKGRISWELFDYQRFLPPHAIEDIKRKLQGVKGKPKQ
jgi:hypothetical protein